MKDDALYRDMLAELLPLARLLEREDALNEGMGIERWPDSAEFLSTRLTNGLLRRVLAASIDAETDHAD